MSGARLKSRLAKAAGLPLAALLAAALSLSLAAGAGQAAEHYPLKMPPRQSWSFSGPFGIYDKAQLQRGLKVYTQTCAACHSLNYVHFRDLQALGYSLPQIKEFAARYSYATIDAAGNAASRPGTPQDAFPAPFANAAQARAANNGAEPPDLSLMARARAAKRPFSFITDLATGYNTQGADYIAALLTGYADPPANITIGEGQYYNPYYLDGPSLAMPPLLQDNMVEYDDGTGETAQQYADDVAAFLTWTADPNRERREQTGLSVLLFLLVLAGLLYFIKRQIWLAVPRNAAELKAAAETAEAEAESPADAAESSSAASGCAAEEKD